MTLVVEIPSKRLPKINNASQIVFLILSKHYSGLLESIQTQDRISPCLPADLLLNPQSRNPKDFLTRSIKYRKAYF